MSTIAHIEYEDRFFEMQKKFPNSTDEEIMEMIDDPVEAWDAGEPEYQDDSR